MYVREGSLHTSDRTLRFGVGGRRSEGIAALNLDIRVHVIGPRQQFVDTYGDFALLSEIDEDGALLVRPDMFIGWRAANSSKALFAELLPAMQSILGLR